MLVGFDVDCLIGCCLLVCYMFDIGVCCSFEFGLIVIGFVFLMFLCYLWLIDACWFGWWVCLLILVVCCLIDGFVALIRLVLIGWVLLFVV